MRCRLQERLRAPQPIEPPNAQDVARLTETGAQPTIGGLFFAVDRQQALLAELQMRLAPRILLPGLLDRLARKRLCPRPSATFSAKAASFRRFGIEVAPLLTAQHIAELLAALHALLRHHSPSEASHAPSGSPLRPPITATAADLRSCCAPLLHDRQQFNGSSGAEGRVYRLR